MLAGCLARSEVSSSLPHETLWACSCFLAVDILTGLVRGFRVLGLAEPPCISLAPVYRLRIPETGF